MTTPDDPNFIPPDPDERIPPPAGATDAGLGGVLVTDVAEIDAAMNRLAAAIADTVTAAAAGMPGAPTWAQVYALARSMLAKWAPGRRGENINDLTYWFYGTWSVAAAFCFIGVSYVLAHALSRTPTAEQQQAGLQLIGGKKAYVPNIRQIPGYETGHSGMEVGAAVAVGGFEHIGIAVRVGTSTFDLWSCNSTDGDSDDAITIKTYPLSAADGHVNLRYGTTPPQQEETLKTLVDLGATKAQTVKAGHRGSLEFEIEYQDPDHVHQDADKTDRYPSVLPSGDDAPYGVTVEVVLAGRPDPGVTLTWAQYERSSNDWVRDIRGEELVGARHTLHSNIRMNGTAKYRADLVNESGHDVVVERAYVLIAR